MYKKAKKEITNLFEDGMSLFLCFQKGDADLRSSAPKCKLSSTA